MKTVVRFSGDQTPLSDKHGGVVSQVSWETLKPFLEKAFMLRNNEKILGLVLDENTVTAYFGNKT